MSRVQKEDLRPEPLVAANQHTAANNTVLILTFESGYIELPPSKVAASIAMMYELEQFLMNRLAKGGMDGEYC